MSIFKAGDILRCASGASCKIVKFLAEGGQGEVYRVQSGTGEFALKWYFTDSGAAEQQAVISDLVKKGPPGERFVWPQDLVTCSGRPSFGYIMPLIPSHFKDLRAYLGRTIKPTPSFRSIVTAAVQVADAFKLLHGSGYCYRDVSPGNLMMDPNTGDMLICDNDNVCVNNKGLSAIGTPDFMAPEVVRMEQKPNIQSDQYSLSVILFHLLCMHHPLYGKRLLLPENQCLDGVARNRLTSKPLFIFDPTDKSNEALDLTADPYGECGNNATIFWPLYPKFVRDLFTEAFTTGLHSPGKRITNLQWKSAMIRLRDWIIPCPSCKGQLFYDQAQRLAQPGSLPRCPQCGHKEVPLPPRIRFLPEMDIVMLNPETKLYPHHVNPQKLGDFSSVVGVMQRHPQHPEKWGLKNLSQTPWELRNNKNETRQVSGGEVCPINKGIKIDFGTRKAQITV